MGSRDILLSRWLVFVAASLLVLLGLLPGVVKETEAARSLHSAARKTDPPHLSKREPLRALSADDRRDGTGTQTAEADGALLVRVGEDAYPVYRTAMAPAISDFQLAAQFRRTALPRAPPERT